MQASPSAHHAVVVRSLGLGSATGLVMANMIGAGVFTTSGFALAELGDPKLVLLAWLFGGLLALCGALSYGALARRMPESGGEYLFLARTVHPAVGFLAGWISLLAGFTAPIAAAALGLEAYFFEFIGTEQRPGWIATAVILAVGLMHGINSRAGARLQAVAAGLMLLVIVGFLALGFHLTSPAMHELASDIHCFDGAAFGVTLVWIASAYSGWNASVYVAGDIRAPQHNVPRSLLLGTLSVTAIYVALNAVFLLAAPVETLAGKAEVGAIAAEALGGPGLRQVVTGVITLALFTSISAMVMTGPRVYARMAADGLLPRYVAARRDVPTVAVALQVAVALLVVWFGDLARLLGYIGFTLSLSAATSVAALMRPRCCEGAERVPIPGYPWVLGLFTLASVTTAGFMVAREPITAALGLLTAAMGLGMYLFAKGRLRSVQSPRLSEIRLSAAIASRIRPR